LAVNDRYKNAKGEWMDETQWFTLVAWSKLATYVEKYLGQIKPNKILEKPTDVDEIRFIDDLLMGFIAAAKATETANEITNESEAMWFPINPADTKLFGINLYPYKRIGKNGLTSHLEIANLLLIRGMTFLGYNSKLTNDEIKGMAEIDTMSMIYSIDDITLKLALSNNLTIEKFLALEGKINGTETGILSPENTDIVYYCYFPVWNTCNYERIMPISDGFSGDWVDTDGIWEFSGPESAVFLTNYNIGEYNKGAGSNLNRIFDGAIYVKIFTPEDFVDVAVDSRVTPENVNFTNNLINVKIRNSFG
jgi:hypothetical protein